MAKKMFISSVKPLVFLVFLLSVICLPTTVQAAPQIEIVSHTSYIESAWDCYTILGEVHNIGDQAAEDVFITSIYYNADNEVISDFGGSFIYLDVLLPGRKSPFGSTDITTDPQLIHHYSLEVSFVPSDSKPEQLEIISHSSTIDPYDGYMHIVGEVDNSGDLQEPLVHVVATCYNEAGEVVDTGSDHVVTVNQKADFDIRILGEHPDPISSYELTAETYDYALIPEFSSYLLTILTVAMVSIALLLYKRKIIKN